MTRMLSWVFKKTKHVINSGSDGVQINDFFAIYTTLKLIVTNNLLVRYTFIMHILLSVCIQKQTSTAL